MLANNCVSLEATGAATGVAGLMAVKAGVVVPNATGCAICGAADATELETGAGALETGAGVLVATLFDAIERDDTRGGTRLGVLAF